MMGSTMRGKSMEKEHFSGATILSSMVNLKTTTLKVMELINGTTVESIMATGRTIKCTVRESLLGLMAENILGLIKRT